jgi:CDP-glycerol glycerophosphotransferase (TagB/SpsB family)
VKTVLYAPTWEGHFADTNYGSLPVGPEIVRALVARECTVIFRPHPYSYKNAAGKERINEIKAILQEDAESSDRNHLYGRAAEKDLDAFGCFNASDAMISDVSSVVPDFLYSGKPYALVSMSFSIDEFLRMFPLARSAYVMPRDLSNIDTALEQLLVTDPKAQQRRQTREYYLGPFAAENYAEAFVDAARNVVLHDHKSTDAQYARTSEADEGGTGDPDSDGEQVSADIVSGAEEDAEERAESQTDSGEIFTGVESAEDESD